MIKDVSEASERDAIRFEMELKHRPEKVWRALVEPELLGRWLLPLMEQRLGLEPGATFHFKTDPHPGWDGVVSCRLIEAEAPRRLSYAWSVPGIDTVVTFTLEPTDTGTRLLLVQSGFKPEQKRESGGARYGWKMMGERLETLLDEQGSEQEQSSR